MYGHNDRKASPALILLIVGAVCMAAAGILSLLARKTAGFAQWYSEHIYEGLVAAVGRFFGFFPFSVAEVLLYLLIAAVVVLTVRLAVRIARRKAGIREGLGFASEIFCLAGVLLLVYVTNCGINYHRTSFAESTGLVAEDYTVSQLAQVCEILTDELNGLAGTVERDGEGLFLLTENVREKAPEVMDNLALEYPQMEGYYPQPKGLLFPQILSVQKITGIYSPFTIEANYNDDITAFNIPSTACHELSHLRGFMKEEEANFIAWLACINADNAEFQYSGYMKGWINCTNALYAADYEKWKEVRVKLDPRIEYDIAANNLYWQQYESKISQTAEKINDQYLKANGQTDGIKSYGRAADLIVAYYIDKGTLK